LKIGIICPDYPSETSHAFAFVHARAKLYDRQSHTVKVFIPCKSEDKYTFEGITIARIPYKHFQIKLSVFNPDVLAVHYPTYKIIHALKYIKFPLVTWIHGHEALWYFTLMASSNTFQWIKKKVVLIPRELVQLLSLRNFFKQSQYNIFVSKWLLEAAQRHMKMTIPNSVVIPNPVDTNLFCYHRPRNIRKGISLRNFHRTVYGLDVAIKAFSNFDNAHLSIFGKGRYFQKYLKLAMQYRSNTTIESQYFAHNCLPQFYHKFGFFVAPSRRETQGLAMCEAMACGLPVIATRVGGIPEFVRDGIDGYLVPPNNPKEIKNAVIRLLSDKTKYFEMSKNSRKNMETICSEKVVIQKEYDVLKKAIDKYNMSGNTNNE